MAIKKYLRRKKHKRGEAQPVPFFQSESPDLEQGNSTLFFPAADLPVKAKLNVSEPGDPQELEADKMADSVVRKKGTEEKDDVSRKEMEDEATLQKKADEEEAVQKQGADHQHPKEKKEGDSQDKLEDEPIATKSNVAGTSGASAVAIRGSEGGTSLPPGVAHEMASSFGYDFSKVKIYTGSKAADAAEQLGARAFTYKGDVYFNAQQFEPSTEKGKWLLAHELTHVVQQRGSELTPVMKKEVPGISTPVPVKFIVRKKEQTIIAAEGKVMGATVRLLPDVSGEVPYGKAAKTAISLQYHIGAPVINAGKITRSGGKAVITLSIQTTYREGVDPSGPSKFGRGTTAEDKKAGNTSLRFHEGSHGERALAFLAQHPLPTFDGKTGDTVEAYEAAVMAFKKQLEDYKAKMLRDNFVAGDCSGVPEPGCPQP